MLFGAGGRTCCRAFSKPLRFCATCSSVKGKPTEAAEWVNNAVGLADEALGAAEASPLLKKQGRQFFLGVSAHLPALKKAGLDAKAFQAFTEAMAPER